MALTRVERERINDSRLKLQSVANSLGHIPREKIPKLEQIEQCIEDAGETLTQALRNSTVSK
jgi:hypothetical protein